MIVDSHVHIQQLPPFAPVGPTAPSFTHRPTEAATAEMLLEEMDQYGIDMTVVVQDSSATWDNGYVADEARKHSDRFVGVGLLDPFDPANATNARYWMTERGLRGFRFHPGYYDEASISRPENRAMWDVLVELNAVVQVHMPVSQATQVDEIAREYSSVPIILDHMSYPDVSDAPDFESHAPIFALAQYENVHVKISDTARQSHDEFPHPAIQVVIKRLVNEFGIERCMWGTGYPGKLRVDNGWPSMEEELRFVREGLSWLNEAERDRLLGGTATVVWSLI
ncbi:MAG: amidohydrolase [Chloroflexi bacterium]|nr:amidohydrolase [Chloroflexota bacterium]